MARQLMTPEELSALMTRELQAKVGHQDCSVCRPIVLKGEDEEGCNWSRPFFQRSGRPAGDCESEFLEVVNWARQRYNVKKP